MCLLRRQVQDVTWPRSRWCVCNLTSCQSAKRMHTRLAPKRQAQRSDELYGALKVRRQDSGCNDPARITPVRTPTNASHAGCACKISDGCDKFVSSATTGSHRREDENVADTARWVSIPVMTERRQYSRHRKNPYPSGEKPHYGLWRVQTGIADNGVNCRTDYGIDVEVDQ